MKVVRTPSIKHLVIFYEKNEDILNFYEDKNKVIYHKLSPANMKPSEKEAFSSAFIYSR
jgi:hypothetical protein